MKPHKVNPIKNRRKFDETFKREAVANWLNSDKSASVIGEELGICPDRLYAWRQRFAPVEPSEVGTASKPISLPQLQAEHAAALREIRHLREQRDILKKTLGILSEPPQSASNGFTR